MPFPAARLTDVTATGDVVTGPGVPTVIIEGMPAAVVGDMVDGAACVGSITVGAFTVLIGGVPAAIVSSVVVGENPETGVPVATAVATGAFTVLLD
jgi:uncharacterized Zn-binding protein involved in type VI secretion